MQKKLSVVLPVEKFYGGVRVGGNFTLPPPPHLANLVNFLIDSILLVLQGSGIIFVSAGRGKAPWEFFEKSAQIGQNHYKSPQRPK